MITILNQPIDFEKTLEYYPHNGIEQQVLTIMQKSSSKYNFDSPEELRFELNLRRAIVNASKELNNSEMDFAIFRKTKCNSDYFTRTNDGGFKLKSDVKPSDAINDIFNKSSKYATECATAMVIVYYKALLDVIGKDAFDKNFKQIHLMNWHYLDNKLEEIGRMQDADDYFPGDRRYFANPDVDPETPQWQGENTIDLSNDLYYGHGIGIHKSSTIIKELNKNRKGGSDKPAYLMKTVGIPNFKKLFKLSK